MLFVITKCLSCYKWVWGCSYLLNNHLQVSKGQSDMFLYTHVLCSAFEYHEESRLQLSHSQHSGSKLCHCCLQSVTVSLDGPSGVCSWKYDFFSSGCNLTLFFITGHSRWNSSRVRKTYSCIIILYCRSLYHSYLSLCRIWAWKCILRLPWVLLEVD